MSDAVEARKILDTFARNVELVSRGAINPIFQNLPDPIIDITSPLGSTSDTIAHSITNVPPIQQRMSSSDIPQGQDKAEIKKIATLCAANLGMILDPALIEDLYVVSSMFGILTDRDIWMYLKGVLRNSQISNTTSLAKLITRVESILARNQQSMASNSDSNKQITERLTLMSQRIEGIAPPICSMIQSEHKITRDKVASMKITSSPFMAPASALASSSSTTPTHPGKEEILLICKSAGWPSNYAEVMSEKYCGIVTWDEYNLVVSGAVSSADIRKMMSSWKKKTTQ